MDIRTDHGERKLESLETRPVPDLLQAELVRYANRKATQKQLEHVNLGEEDLRNTLYFKYLGVMLPGDGDLLAPVNHSMAKACSALGI